MLEQPCARCDALLDVNADTCPRCGAPRRGRARERHPARGVRWRWLGAGALVGLLLATALWLRGTVEGRTLLGVFLLGVIGGAVITVIQRLRASNR
ncbi:MAG TPA: hypothetical protein PLZ36_05535 [Armatimonadota bacterium]|nr:hypothetical protein [Armatimonadota bacterium]